MPGSTLVRRTERLRFEPFGVARAAELLRGGRLVAFGTETVYGLGADAGNAAAVDAVFAAKERPSRNPLIVHVADAAAAFELVDRPVLARRLAELFWPGPLTMVLPRRSGAPVRDAAAAGLPSLAVRVPSGPAAQALLRAAGRPVVAPSANRSGRISPSEAAHVLAELDGRIDAVLDGGPCGVGLESTVVAVAGDHARLLRPGAVTVEALREAGIAVRSGPADDDAAPASPGMLRSHYAPRLPLRLDATEVEPDEALLAFGVPLPHPGPVWNLSPDGNIAEAAFRLYAGLRVLDAGTARGIAAMPIPLAGLGLAIRDRLVRAAAPRPSTRPPATGEPA